MLEAFKRWLKRYGSRPWEDELQKAFEAGYRAGMKHDQAMKYAPRRPRYSKMRAAPKLITHKPKPVRKSRAKPVKVERDLYLEALMERAKDNER